MSLATRPTERLKSLPIVLLGLSLLMTACSNMSSPEISSPAPSFVSAPPTTANQGSIYTYQIATSTGSATLALTMAPSGATLNGDTITWTPSAAQSRLSNQFSVRATSAAGSTTQSWTVTPAGTVSGTWVDTYWTANGPIPRPIDWTTALPLFPQAAPAALVPQPDGSFQTLQGSGNSDGTFSIPNVPGGYYWLQPTPAAFYWTSSSSFDLGADVAEPLPTKAPLNSTTTSMGFNLAGLDPVQTGDQLAFLWGIYPPFSLANPATVNSALGATTGNLGATINGNLDFSQPGTAFFMQYEPESIGTLAALALGAEVSVSNLSLTNGTANTLSETLAPSPQHSFDLNIKGSLWMPLFNGAGPSPLTPLGAHLQFAVNPFVTSHNLAPISLSIPLVIDPKSINPAFALPVAFGLSGGCDASGPNSSGFSGEPVISADQDFGPVQYSDPFPSEWAGVFSFCQYASVPVPIPGSTTPITFQLVNQQSNSSPPSQVAPLVGQVQSPKINGANLLTAGMVVPATGVTLNWDAPNGTTPTGYKITLYIPVTFPSVIPGTPSILTYFSSRSFYTTKTSALLPPLQAGQTYVFLITAILDSAANFETQPNHSALPTASASVISAPITASGP